MRYWRRNISRGRQRWAALVATTGVVTKRRDFLPYSLWDVYMFINYVHQIINTPCIMLHICQLGSYLSGRCAWCGEEYSAGGTFVCFVGKPRKCAGSDDIGQSSLRC